MSPIRTVNVLHCRVVKDADNGSFGWNIIALVSFPDTQKGNEAAEALFRKKVYHESEVLVTKEDLDNYTEDGLFEENGTSIILLHDTYEP